MLRLVTLFCLDHGKMSKETWIIMEKSWNLIAGNRWEPCITSVFSGRKGAFTWQLPIP